MSIENIKKLREITQSGFMDVKKALEATDNDIEKAIIWLRENGILKAAKKQDRISAEGIINIVGNDKKVLIIEINSETDFVASNEKFLKSVEEISNGVLNFVENNDQEELKKIKINDLNLEDYLSNLTSIIGEKIVLRRFHLFNIENNNFSFYKHSNSRIGTIILAKDMDKEILKDISMHIAAMNPKYLDMNDVPKEKIDLEIKLAKKELKDVLKGKNEKSKEGIINGKINKVLSDIVLLNQIFVKDSSKKIKDLQKKGKILDFVRFEVGEGIEKKIENFDEEVQKLNKK